MCRVTFRVSWTYSQTHIASVIAFVNLTEVLVLFLIVVEQLTMSFLPALWCYRQ